MINRSFTPFLVLLLLSTVCIAWTIIDIEPRHKIDIHGTIYEWSPGRGHYRDSTLNPKGDPVAATLYVRRVNHGYRGVMPICDTIISDSLGHFRTQLEEGDYSLFEPWQLEPLIMPKDSAWMVYDTACIRKQYTDPSVKLHVYRDSVDITLYPRKVKNLRCRIK